MEKRTIRQLGEVRVASGDGEKKALAGYIAKFEKLSENLGYFQEKIARGAFTESIKKDDIRALVNHDPNLVLGRNTAGTLRLWEDEIGLAYEVDLPNTTWANDYYESVKRGDITQCSFGFYADSYTWDWDSTPAQRTLNKVTLFDVSPVVTYPAYADTQSQARAKGLDIETPEETYRTAKPWENENILKLLELEAL